ncbi:hypothetical protein K402DRAFT_451267 [Aulographum hederae CBS 113979]|uniref:Uncharacterized protein n=1 Tax=Aulographum hederae CBS 113979 TaxID=1176131 RepID=A0A6G1HBF4_9PEZI|nr:hypothetical protein K402DRAFT_451267 [Aulographum hederae CBS 113979]
MAEDLKITRILESASQEMVRYSNFEFLEMSGKSVVEALLGSLDHSRNPSGKERFLIDFQKSKKKLDSLTKRFLGYPVSGFLGYPELVRILRYLDIASFGEMHQADRTWTSRIREILGVQLVLLSGASERPWEDTDSSPDTDTRPRPDDGSSTESIGDDSEFFPEPGSPADSPSQGSDVFSETGTPEHGSSDASGPESVGEGSSSSGSLEIEHGAPSDESLGDDSDFASDPGSVEEGSSGSETPEIEFGGDSDGSIGEDSNLVSDLVTPEEANRIAPYYKPDLDWHPNIKEIPEPVSPPPGQVAPAPAPAPISAPEVPHVEIPSTEGGHHKSKDDKKKSKKQKHKEEKAKKKQKEKEEEAKKKQEAKEEEAKKKQQAKDEEAKKNEAKNKANDDVKILEEKELAWISDLPMTVVYGGHEYINAELGKAWKCHHHDKSCKKFEKRRKYMLEAAMKLSEVTQKDWQKSVGKHVHPNPHPPLEIAGPGPFGVNDGTGIFI